LIVGKVHKYRKEKKYFSQRNQSVNISIFTSGLSSWGNCNFLLVSIFIIEWEAQAKFLCTSFYCDII
jgi:hypothetical protein